MKKIKKYLSPSGNLPRRRLKFTPEQVALFESSFLNKGMNNSGGQKLKEQGVLVLQYLKLKKREEEARIRSRSERPHVLKRKATPAEKLREGRDEYALTTQIVGMSGRDPLLGTIFDLYVGGKGLESLFKSGSWLYNNGKIILKSIPYNPENFYRAVGKDAIKDALKSGIIRSSSKEYLYNPYFSHGRLFWTGERVIEGRQGPVLWVKAKGPNGEYGLNDVIKPGEKNLSSGHVPTEVFPYSNGSTQVSTEGFSYWKKHPIVGWREYKFKQGGKMNTLLFLKNGSGIHIKKKNRGKFTDYCGGKVTDECIRRAKASGNPTLVKRATFAANARKWKHKNGGKAFVEGVNVLDSNPKAYKYVKKKYKMHLKGGNLVTNYIKAIENPNRVGWNGKVWQAPNLKGYDINLRGYGIDINTNLSAKKLTNGRPGRWITDAEATKLMNDHISYITNAANKHIKGFNKLSPQRLAALLGMLYRGDSVNKSGINYLVDDDKKFFTSIGNYYRSKGLNERANNSDKFFGKYLLKGGSIDWTSTLANVGSNILQGYFLNKKISKEAEAAKAMNKLTSLDLFNIYNLKLQEAKQQEELLAKAIEAMTGTTINSSNIVAANNAWKNASREYAALKNNVDLQNRAIDAQAQALKSNIWGNAISGVMLQGVGLLSNYLNNKKSSNITTGITTPSITAPSYNYFSAPKKFGTFNSDGSMNLGYNMTYSIDKGIQTKKWSDDIFNKSYTDYLK